MAIPKINTLLYSVLKTRNLLKTCKFQSVLLLSLRQTRASVLSLSVRQSVTVCIRLLISVFSGLNKHLKTADSIIWYFNSSHSSANEGSFSLHLGLANVWAYGNYSIKLSRRQVLKFKIIFSLHLGLANVWA